MIIKRWIRIVLNRACIDGYSVGTHADRPGYSNDTVAIIPIEITLPEPQKDSKAVQIDARIYGVEHS